LFPGFKNDSIAMVKPALPEMAILSGRSKVDGRPIVPITLCWPACF
jgi:hypothetical protein